MNKATLKGHGNPTEIMWFGNGKAPKARGLRVTVSQKTSKIHLLDENGDPGQYFGAEAEDLRIIGRATKFWAEPVS